MKPYSKGYPAHSETECGEEVIVYPPSQKTMGISPWMNAKCGSSEARRAKEDASADSAEEMKDTTGVSPWRLHRTEIFSLTERVLGT